jgi:hypothetical protein
MFIIRKRKSGDEGYAFIPDGENEQLINYLNNIPSSKTDKIIIKTKDAKAVARAIENWADDKILEKIEFEEI